MSRRLLPIAVAAALGAVVLIGVALLSAPGPATESDRVELLAAQLRCPDCQALSVAESRTRAADAIRAEISSLVADGRSDDEIRGHFVERYGQWILLAPPDPVAWWPPVMVVLVAIAAFGAWLLRGRSRPGAAAASPTEPESRRIREELEALDG